MNPVVSIINGGEKYLGFAKKKLAALELWRRQFNQLTAKLPLIHTGDAMILIRCSQWEQHITIIGLLGSGNILLAANKDGTTVFSVYDFLTEAVSPATSLPNFTLSEPLSPTYNQRCQVGESALAAFSSHRWSASIVGETGFTYLGGVNAYEMSFFADQSRVNILARVGDQISLAATVRTGDVLLPSLCGRLLNLFGLSSYPSRSLWNQYQAASVFSLTPNTGTLNEVGAWLPAFFVVEPTDYYGLKPGWYYGRYPGSVYSMDEPLTSLKVSLSGLLETRLVGGLTQWGWCETVTEVDGEAKGDIFFYLDRIDLPGNDYAYRELVTGSYVKAFITIGTSLSGRDADFVLQTTRLGSKPDEVKFWNLPSWTAEDSIPVRDAIGILIVEGKKLRGYRHKGYAELFIETDAFHSYAISDDGRLVAIFEATGGDTSDMISRVRVFDLYGERVVAKAKDPDYARGGYTEISTSEVVAPLSALTACFIPVREKNVTPQPVTLPFANPGHAAATERDFFPSLSTLRFMKDGTSGLSIAKVLCKNGVDAEFGISVDECFDSKIVVDDPDQQQATDRLVSKWDAGGNFRGVVRGAFEGQHPDMRFNGVGKGSSGWYGTITMPPRLSIVSHVDGTYSFDGVAGEIVSTTCLTDDMRLDPDCVPRCDGNITIEAESSCGQKGELEIERELPPLFISGPSTFGGTFNASGGRPPYRFSSSCGRINEVTGEVIDSSGCCGEILVTVEDSCSQVASMTVRGPSGTWNIISITKADDDVDGISRCTSDALTNEFPWMGYCNTYNCYCGDEYYYLGPTLRFYTCKMPGWGPGKTIDDCSQAYCYAVTERFACTSVPHTNDC